jgi:hypothetical protein
MNENVLSTGGITLTEKTRRTRRKTYLSVVLCTTEYTRNKVRLNTSFFGDNGRGETFVGIFIQKL